MFRAYKPKQKKAVFSGGEQPGAFRHSGWGTKILTSFTTEHRDYYMELAKVSGKWPW